LALERPEQGIWSADASYLEEILRKEQFQVDAQAVSEYFPIRVVQQGVIDTVSALFGLAFEPAQVPVWHADVTAFNVRDARTQSLLGRAYLDLSPRDHKYKHAAMFGLRDTVQEVDGTRVVPLAALVCNFSARLSHNEVTTFFHEFGHLLHHLLSQSPLASFAGVSVARDFVEAPSQMLEEWAWDTATLQQFSKHHTTGEPIPTDLCQALIAARTFGEAIFTERQLFLATLDQTYHTREPGFDTSAVVADTHHEFSSFVRLPDTHFQASFGHLVGYDAAYYGYQWALTIAHDLFTRFQTEGLMNATTAQEYRERILAPGGGQDEAELIQQFLGRPTNTDAYQAYLGISAP
jgi:thimet oligopeptidase